MLTEVDMARIMDAKQSLVKSVSEPIDCDLFDDVYLPVLFVVDPLTAEMQQAD